MNRQTLSSKALFVLLIAMAIFCTTAVTDEDTNDQKVKFDPSKEPPLKFDIIINGKKYPITEEIEITLPIKADNPKVKLIGKPIRTFRFKQLSFDYPRNLRFSSSKSDFDFSWNFDGNECTIYVQYDPTKSLNVDELTESYKIAYGEKAKVTKGKVKWGGNQYDCRNISSDDESLLGEGVVVQIELGKESYNIWINDTPQEIGGMSEERKQIITLLKKTLKIKQKE